MNLTLNSNSLGVVKLQLQLRWLGHYYGLIDGLFTKPVFDAVQVFQKKHGLYVDGVAGPKTKGVIDTLTKDAYLVHFIHCSATPEGRDVKAKDIVYYHTKVKDWSRPGYAKVIELDGATIPIWDLNDDDIISDGEYTFGVKWNTLLNRNAKHTCYIGGGTTTPIDTRTDNQHYALETIVRYELLLNPGIVFAGHNQVQNKGCPSFDVPDWCRELEIPEHNIANWGKLYA